MSLRLRLSLILGAAFVLIWALAATWMFRDLRSQMMFSLDQRLVASARMVAGMVDRLPQPLATPGEGARFSADQWSIPDGIACQISSLRGEILARSHSNADQVLDDERTGFHDQEIDGEHWRSFTLARDDVRITTADRELEREALNRSVMLAASAPVLMALLGSIAMLWLGIGKGLAPLNRMCEALRKRDVDALDPLVLKSLPSELRPLLDTQNQLFLRIGRTLERERRLTGDAAHELRSPLTAIKTHLQVARMTAGLAHEQALAHAEEGADRLQRTLEQLLLLARVEGSLSFDDGAPCSAEHVARLAIGDASQEDRWRVELHMPPQLPSIALGMPSTLAVQALRNLIDNALRHSPERAPVWLTLATEPGWVCFTVRDFGPGIGAEDLQHLTQRFWRSRASAGCGLGLAIVQAIAQRCGCTLDFDSGEDGLRASFRIPVRPL
ncbi:sensor histidine kinase N-terminal domain-containing protein [Pseudomonas sp. CFBP 8770]|uniref:ATP-binding protein n=1 Tax=unclassified Pseudomonas TaxID=196821 RepID=UPI00177BF430|nr:MULTISPECIES: ATP-binding protein [unclassified Pseudomonas]MBD8475195.1 sensor histidine kinase N-terminal domain-containing protein [Pseudomonas sp. CFBP 8773]MBD8645542.1 sensor histidine kinase N-terminal domain-containing protein [Pseudomonas sp. CFBP 8770]